MTTDITELAQSLKAAAEKWQEAWGKYDKVEITIAEFIRAANQYESIVKDPANVIELVEALEKAQADGSEYAASERAEAVKNVALQDEIYGMKSRIAELESRSVKLPSELELRNNEVCSVCAGNALQVIEDKLTAADIKWEAE